MSYDNDVLGIVVKRGIERKQSDGYPCPVCGAAMHISLHQILEGKHIICPACGYKIVFQDGMKQQNCRKNSDKSQ